MSVTNDDIFANLPPIVDLEKSYVSNQDSLGFFQPKPQNTKKKLTIEELKKLDLNIPENLALINNTLKYNQLFKQGKPRGSTYASSGKTILRTEFPKNWAAAKILGFQIGQRQHIQKHQLTIEKQQEAQGRKAASEDRAKGRKKTNMPSSWSKAKRDAYKNYVKKNKSKFDDVESQQQKAELVAKRKAKYYDKHRESLIEKSNQYYHNSKKDVPVKSKKRKVDQTSTNPNEFFNASEKKSKWEIIQRNENGTKLTLRRTR